VIDALSPWGVLSSWTDFRGHLSTIEVPFSRLEGVIQLIPRTRAVDTTGLVVVLARAHSQVSNCNISIRISILADHNLLGIGIATRNAHRPTRTSASSKSLRHQIRGDQSWENERNTR